MKIAVLGASGKTGSELCRSVLLSDSCTLTAGIIGNAGLIGQNIANHLGVESDCKVFFSNKISDLFNDSDVIIDFSHPIATESMLSEAIKFGYSKTILICTTNLSVTAIAMAKELGNNAKVAIVSNTSMGVAIQTNIVRKLAKSLVDADVEILEKHHRHKIDSPSGTSLSLGMAVAEGRGVSFAEVATFGRSGVAKRKDGEIGFSVVRGGEVAGEHSVMFMFGQEVLEIKHTAFSRSVFAAGALSLAQKIFSLEKCGFLSSHFIESLIANLD